MGLSTHSCRVGRFQCRCRCGPAQRAAAIAVSVAIVLSATQRNRRDAWPASCLLSNQLVLELFVGLNGNHTDIVCVELRAELGL